MQSDFLFGKNENLSGEAQKEIIRYNNFFGQNKLQPLSHYGLIPFSEKGSSPFHTDEYVQTLQTDFAFDAAFIWEDITDEALIERAISSVQYGNITIAYEGCGIYWLLIISGKHQGEIWLLTEFGITPVAENLTLEKWKDLQLSSNNSFWHAAVASWGPFENAFFYSHAPAKMLTAGENIFGVTGCICKTCIDFISKFAVHEKKEFVVTDENGTRIFNTEGKIEIVSKNPSH